MKVALHSFLIISLFSLLILSCDKIDDPFPPNLDESDTSIIWDDSIFSKSNAGERYIVLEEYTGHTCTNCPAAAVEVERLRTLYGPKFIPIAIHATETFAAPKVLPGAPSGSYQTDHRTDESLDYENEDAFGVLRGLPRGMVSRKGPNDNKSLVKDKWKQKCDEIYNNPGPTLANIHITNFFDDSTKKFKVRIQIEWLENYTGGMNLQIQVREDNIVDWQLDGSDNIENYLFEHMFRGSINGAWGIPLSAANAGETTDTSFTRSIETYLGRGREYDINNYEKTDFVDWSVIAFIYMDSPDFEVLQVNEAHLTAGH